MLYVECNNLVFSQSKELIANSYNAKCKSKKCVDFANSKGSYCRGFCGIILKFEIICRCPYLKAI